MPNEVKSGTPPEPERMIATASAPFNIDAVDDVAGYATVYGRTVKVLHIDGAAYRALRRMSESGDTDISPLYDTVARCCPDLSSEEVDRLRPKQMAFLLGIAGAMVDMVEDEQQRQVEARAAEDPDPNGSRPTSSESPASA